MARRAGSECDPVLRLLDAKGAVVTEVDDAPGIGKDSRIEWKAPADATLFGADRRSPRPGRRARFPT